MPVVTEDEFAIMMAERDSVENELRAEVARLRGEVQCERDKNNKGDGEDVKQLREQFEREKAKQSEAWSRMHDEVIHLEKERKDLLRRLEDFERATEGADQITALRTQVEDAEYYAEEKEKEVAELQEEVKRLKAQSKSAAPVAGHDAQRKALEAELGEREARVCELTASVEELTAKLANLKMQNDQKDDTEERLHPNEGPRTVESSSAEVAALLAQLEEEQSKTAELEEEIEQLRETEAKAQADIEALRQALGGQPHVSSELRALNSQISELKGSVAEKDQLIKEMEREMRDLKGKQESKKGGRKKKEEAELELALKKMTTAKEKAEQEAEALRAECSELEGEKHRLDTARDAAEKDCVRLREAKKKAEEEVERLQAALAAKPDSPVKSKGKKKSETEAKLKEALAERDRLHEENEALHHELEAEREKLGASLKAAVEEVEQLQRKAGKEGQDDAERKEKDRSIKALRKTVVKLEEKLSDATAQLEALKGEVSEQKAETVRIRTLYKETCVKLKAEKDKRYKLWHMITDRKETTASGRRSLSAESKCYSLAPTTFDTETHISPILRSAGRPRTGRATKGAVTVVSPGDTSMLNDTSSEDEAPRVARRPARKTLADYPVNIERAPPAKKAGRCTTSKLQLRI